MIFKASIGCFMMLLPHLSSSCASSFIILLNFDLVFTLEKEIYFKLSS
jgi:hypothetical protein